MGSAETATQLQILAAGRNPQWVTQLDTDLPNSAGSGVSLEGGDGVAALLKISLREVVHERRARVTVASLDGSANYTVTVDGVAIATTSGSFADEDAVLVELKAKIDADAAVGQAATTPVIDSTLLDSNGDSTVGTAGGGNAAATLRINSESPGAYSIDISATGTGVLACEADAESAYAYPMVKANGSGANTPPGAGWDLAPDADHAVTWMGSMKRLDVGGLNKGQVYLDSITGHASDGSSVTYYAPVVAWGVAVLE